MTSIFDIFFTLRGVTAVFKLGFVPKDGELYELTPEQKLRYCASVMPSVISKGTKYEHLGNLCFGNLYHEK
jgi:hypothetical protein